MASLFEKLIKLIKAYFILVGVLVTLGFMTLYFAIKNSSGNLQISTQSAVKLETESLVHINWNSLTLKESSGHENPFQLIFSDYLSPEKNAYAPEMQSYFKSLALDDRVKGLFIELGVVSGSLALLSELRQLLEEFKKESGKPIYFWLPYADTKGYYLASLGDEILLPPLGTLQLLGPMVHQVYFGDAIRKIGVDLNVIKNGSHKSAPEVYLRNSPSSFARKMYQELESSLRETLIKEISTSSRNLNTIQLNKAFDKSLFTASEALSEKLVNDLAYLPEAKERYTKKYELPLYKFSDYLANKEYEKYPAHKNVETQDGIALIEAVGEIHNIASKGQEGINLSKITKEIEWAKGNENVKAVVLRISSPGGDAHASDLIWEEVRRLTEVKPVVVSMGTSAASGGYYIAAPAQKIYADPYTITGSIGAFQIIGNLKRFEEKYGISFYVETQSKRKDLIDMGKEPTEEDKKILQNLSNTFYNAFVQKVSLGRKLSESQVRSIAGGRVWSAAQGLEIKLIDEIGTLKEALAGAKELAGFRKEEPIPVMKWIPEIKTLSDCFTNTEAMKKCFSYGKMSFSKAFMPSSFKLLNEAEKTFQSSLTPGKIKALATEKIL